MEISLYMKLLKLHSPEEQLWNGWPGFYSQPGRC